MSSGSWRWSIRERVTGTPRRPVGFWFWRAATFSSWCFSCPAAGFRHPDGPRLVRAIDAVFVNAATQVLAPDGRPGLFLFRPVYSLAAISVLGTCSSMLCLQPGPWLLPSRLYSSSTRRPASPLASSLSRSSSTTRPSTFYSGAPFGGHVRGVVLMTKWAPTRMEARSKRSPRMTVNAC